MLRDEMRDPTGGGRRRTGTKLAAVLAAVLLMVGVAACSSSDDSATDTSQSTATTTARSANEIRIGALLSITGDGSTLGTSSQAALEIAAERWNERFEQAGDSTRVVLQVENTEQEPDKAVAALERLADWGAEIVIGPQSSSEVAAIDPVATERGVLVVSQGSTASSLAADDNVFRFVPNDHVEGRAMVDLLAHDGITTVVPVWRNDRGNQGLADSVRSIASAQGVTVAEGVMYEPNTTNFTETLQQVVQQVSQATSGAPAAQVGVYLAGFEEVADVLAAAGSMDGGWPDGVRWYGGDGSARSTVLISTPGSAAFAMAVGGYPNPLLALPPSQSADEAALIADIAQMAGHEPDAFALAAYDAFDVAVNAVVTAGVGSGVDTLRTNFVDAAQGYVGVTGTIELDAQGDRTSGPFTFWSICSTSSGDQWVPTASWQPAADPTQPGTLTAGSCASPVS